VASRPNGSTGGECFALFELTHHSEWVVTVGFSGFRLWGLDAPPKPFNPRNVLCKGSPCLSNRACVSIATLWKGL
jgi:hypothetical protein